MSTLSTASDGQSAPTAGEEGFFTFNTGVNELVVNFADYVAVRAIISDVQFVFRHTRLAYNIMDDAGGEELTAEAFHRFGPLLKIADEFTVDIVFGLLAESDLNGRVLLRAGRFEKYIGALRHVLDVNKGWEKLKQKLGIDPNEVLLKHSTSVSDHTEAGRVPIPGIVYLSHRQLYFESPLLRKGKMWPLEGLSRADRKRIGVFQVDNGIELFGRVAAEKNPILAFTKTRDVWMDYITEMAEAYRLSSLLSIRRRQPMGSPTKEASSAVEDEEEGESPRGPPLGPPALPLVATVARSLSEEKKEEKKIKGPGDLLASIRKEVEAAVVRAGKPNEVKTVEEKDAWVSDEEEEMSQDEASPERDHVDVDDVPLVVQMAADNVLRARALSKVTGRHEPTMLICQSKLLNERSLVTAQEKQVVGFGSRLRGFMSNFLIDDGVSRRSLMEEPFQYRRLVMNIDALGYLIDPVVNFVGWLTDVVQWRVPSSSLLTFAGAVYICLTDRLSYIPTIFVFLLVLSIILERIRRAVAGPLPPPVLKEKLSVFQVMRTIQNGVGAVNILLLKFRALHLWTVPWMSKAYGVALLILTFILALLPARHVVLLIVVYMFTLNNLFRWFPRLRQNYDFIGRFWEDVPSDPAGLLSSVLLKKKLA